METAREVLKAYLLKEVIPDADPEELTDTTALVTTGILDSLATIKLVAFLEERFAIEIRPHEMDVENLNTLQSLAELVESKLRAAG